MYIPIGVPTLRRIVRRSTHRWAHHVAVLCGASGILSVGYNRGTMHAEAMALAKLRMTGGRATRLYSVRIRRDGKIGASKPCEDCERLCREAGIRYVYYNDYDGKQERMRL